MLTFLNFVVQQISTLSSITRTELITFEIINFSCVNYSGCKCKNIRIIALLSLITSQEQRVPHTALSLGNNIEISRFLNNNGIKIIIIIALLSFLSFVTPKS